MVHLFKAFYWLSILSHLRSDTFDIIAISYFSVMILIRIRITKEKGCFKEMTISQDG